MVHCFPVEGLRQHGKPQVSEEEQALLKEVSLRPIGPDARDRFDELICREHYLHGSDLVGEQLRYVAESRGQWVGLLAWSAAAFHLKDREAWIGWTGRQKRRRLTLVVNNSRFLIRTERRLPNLASRVMKLCLQRLSADWLRVYGHNVLVAESFVDSQLFQGTCYRASGGTLLGQTQGYRRARQEYYVAHERPKQLWVRELRPGARTILRGRNLPVTLKALEEGQVPECPQSPEELGRMRGFFAGLPDWRKKQGAYALASLVPIVSAYTVKGGRGLGSEWVTRKSNEIPAAQVLLRRAPIEGMRVWSAPFPPRPETDLVQRVEMNRRRPEARCLIRFDATAEQACFPAVQPAARLTRSLDRDPAQNQGPEQEGLISSRPHGAMSAEAMYWADRRYWGIENGLHLRLDVTAGEDRSRVRLPTAAPNLAMIRRATVSLAVHWIARCHNQRQATLQGFYDFMAARNARKAFSLVSVSNASWLPPREIRANVPLPGAPRTCFFASPDADYSS